MLPRQVSALRSGTVIPEYIWVWQNRNESGLAKIALPRKCVLVQSNYNFIYHGRFSLALLAQRFAEYVLLIDDDILPGKRWVENCLGQMQKNPGLYVGVGNRLRNPGSKADTKRPWFGWRAPNEKTEEVDYGGHAWFLKTEWLKYFWGETPISLENAEDIQLSFCLQKHGIKTYVPPHPQNMTEYWSNTIGWEYGKKPTASHKHPATNLTSEAWFAQRREIERECIKRGWQPMFTRGEM
jgi:hypothetical protein